MNSNIEWIKDLNCLTDIHVHLDGSLSYETVKYLARLQKIDIDDNGELKNILSVESDCRDLNEYLQKFEFPLKLLQTQEAIRYAVSELIREQEQQGIIYSEIRFAPQLHTQKGLTQKEVVEAACMGIDDSRKYWRMYSDHNLILCCMRGKDNEALNYETVDVAKRYVGKGNGTVVAVDLAGAEGLYPTNMFSGIFREIYLSGIPFTIHAGEAAGVESMKYALDFGAKRIGHGIRSVESDDMVEYLVKNDIYLELCPTSNLNTKIYQRIEDYPVTELIERGVKVTVNTDNMTVSDTNEAKEMALLADTFNLDKRSIRQLVMNSIEASFTDESIKNRLRAIAEMEFAQVMGVRG